MGAARDTAPAYTLKRAKAFSLCLIYFKNRVTERQGGREREREREREYEQGHFTGSKAVESLSISLLLPLALSNTLTQHRPQRLASLWYWRQIREGLSKANSSHNI